MVFATPGTSGAAGGAINRFTMRFSEAIVPVGDPRAASPVTVKCAVTGAGRWVDDAQTWVYEFERPLPGGLTCKFELRNDLKSVRGADMTGTTSFTVDTGGPSARAIFAGQDSDEIEEDQVFLVASNTPATPQSVATGAYCAVDGIGERIPVDVLGRDVAGKVLADLGDDWDSRNFLENAGLPQTVPTNAQERTAALSTITALKCRRPLPPGKDVALVWGKTITGLDGRLAGTDERYDFSVRKAFNARWSCSRINPQSGCNPVEEARVIILGGSARRSSTGNAPCIPPMAANSSRA